MTGRGDVEELRREDPLWPGELAMLVALLLQLALPSRLTIGPNWPLPVVGAVLVAAFVVTGGHAAEFHRKIRISLVVVVTVANLIALGFLTHYLLNGAHVPGANLMSGGGIIWTANLLLFGVLYWELDRGGPAGATSSRGRVTPDFLFTEMTAGDYAPPAWKPSFVDYLYVSLTDQTAFSPTDTMPLTRRVKLLMGVQGVAALVTVGIVIARAVSLLD